MVKHCKAHEGQLGEVTVTLKVPLPMAFNGLDLPISILLAPQALLGATRAAPGAETRDQE
jgi:hypothetical protein